MSSWAGSRAGPRSPHELEMGQGGRYSPVVMSSASWEMRVEAQLHEALLQIRETLVGEYSETLDSLLG